VKYENGEERERRETTRPLPSCQRSTKNSGWRRSSIRASRQGDGGDGNSTGHELLGPTRPSTGSSSRGGHARQHLNQKRMAQRHARVASQPGSALKACLKTYLGLRLIAAFDYCGRGQAVSLRSGVCSFWAALVALLPILCFKATQSLDLKQSLRGNTVVFFSS
jgi:hypothetical protein